MPETRRKSLQTVEVPPAAKTAQAALAFDAPFDEDAALEALNLGPVDGALRSDLLRRLRQTRKVLAFLADVGRARPAA